MENKYSKEDLYNEKLLYQSIATASLDEPVDFSNKILEILLRCFPLKAASLYSFSPESEILVLRAQTGLSYDLYESFELPIDTFAGKAIKVGKVFFSDTITHCQGYRDKRLIESFDLNSIVAVPLLFESNLYPDVPNPLGVICVYPTEIKKIDLLLAQLKEVAPFIARLYVASVDQLKMILRKALVERAGYSHEISGLLHRIVKTFQDSLRLEGASLFLHDSRNNFLRLMAITGHSESIERSKFFYLPTDTNKTYASFRDNKIMILEGENDIVKNVGPVEKLVNKPRNCILCPIEQASVHPKQNKRVIGVLRGINRVLSHGDVSHITTYSWEEIVIIRFYCEMVSVLVHFMKKGLNAENDFNRSMHGAKNNLQAVLFNLMLLEKHGNIKVKPKMRYYVSDSIAFLSDIWSQVKRLELLHNEKLEVERVALYGDLLSKIPPMIHRAAHAYRCGHFKVTQLNEAGFDSLPHVEANKEALFSVFRNLVENAVKYCKTSEGEREIEFSYEILDNSLKIYIADNGVGITSEYADLIFVEGFRAEEAIVRYPASNGIGLSDAYELMKKMNGAIRYLPNRAKTTFEVEIPLHK